MTEAGTESLRRGAGSMRYTSRIPCPAAAGSALRRLQFVFADTNQRAASEKRRKAVAEQDGAECVVIVEVARPVPVEIAEQFVRECPHYVRDTFAPCGPR